MLALAVVLKGSRRAAAPHSVRMLALAPWN